MTGFNSHSSVEVGFLHGLRFMQHGLVDSAHLSVAVPQTLFRLHNFDYATAFDISELPLRLGLKCDA